jgi:hypothetical protein
MRAGSNPWDDRLRNQEMEERRESKGEEEKRKATDRYVKVHT